MKLLNWSLNRVTKPSIEEKAKNTESGIRKKEGMIKELNGRITWLTKTINNFLKSSVSTEPQRDKKALAAATVHAEAQREGREAAAAMGATTTWAADAQATAPTSSSATPASRSSISNKTGVDAPADVTKAGKPPH